MLIPEIKIEVTLLGPGMMDHPKGWITHEGLTVNGRKGLYHDVLPQPAWKNDDQKDVQHKRCEDTPEESVEPEPQAEVARKPSSKKASKQKTVILASAAVPAYEHILSPPVREAPECLPS